MRNSAITSPVWNLKSRRIASPAFGGGNSAADADSDHSTTAHAAKPLSNLMAFLPVAMLTRLARCSAAAYRGSRRRGGGKSQSCDEGHGGRPAAPLCHRETTMEPAMPRNTAFDSRIGDIFRYWVMTV